MYGMKTYLFNKSLSLHRWIAKKFGYNIQVIHSDNVSTRKMAYDLENAAHTKEYEKYYDYCRYRTMELLADEVFRKYTKKEIENYKVAEAGVNLGDFSWLIQKRFPQSELYLYDTFEGFDSSDMQVEINNSFTTDNYLKELDRGFSVSRGENITPEERMEIVRSKMESSERCIFRKGYFPDSAKEEKNEKWIFVSLDMDLYKPMLDGILFFWPNLVEGGYIMAHDYNNREFKGVRKALEEAESILGTTIHKVPIGDQGGTVILCK